MKSQGYEPCFLKNPSPTGGDYQGSFGASRFAFRFVFSKIIHSLMLISLQDEGMFLDERVKNGRPEGGVT